MPFTNDEQILLNEYIKRNELRNSLWQIREFMEDLWSIGSPLIIKDYTDHGEAHSQRIVSYAKKILSANTGDKLSEEEMYLLLAGIYLHDIGMQCDVSKFPNIKNTAKDLGADFGIEFTAKTANSFNLEEQKAIRKNHHLLTAAWIKYARSSGDTELGNAISSVPQQLVMDLMDICKYHSQLPIEECSENFYVIPGRKRLIAAVLRFADELDISNNRVSIEILKNFALNPENSLYWWLHHQTTVNFEEGHPVLIKIMLSPRDMTLYGSFIEKMFIEKFMNKNKQVLNVLAKGKIPIHIDSDSSATEYLFAENLPPEVIEEVENIKRNDNLYGYPDTAQTELFRKDNIEQIYEGIYGSRSSHFRREKIALAKEVVDRIDSYLLNPDFSALKFCLLIDSGTTSYHVFRQICLKMEDPKEREIWRERIYIVTNNLLGLQHMMMNCKEDPTSERSEIAIKCFFLPGKPLEPYVAVACEETIEWLSNRLDKFLDENLASRRSNYKIISIMSASYFVRHEEEGKISYYPVAREKGHVNVKKKFAEISDKIFLMAPLLKFSFAELRMLNDVNGFNITQEKYNPISDDRSKLEYLEIPLANNKCIFFTTKRKENNLFYPFSEELVNELKKIYENVEIIEDFEVKSQADELTPEIFIEIPHKKLQYEYASGLINIWDLDWVRKHKNEHNYQY